MKINPIFRSVQFAAPVREKSDQFKDSRHSQSSHQDHSADSESQQDSEQPADSEYPDVEKLGKAIDSFQSDQQAQSNGLSARVEGSGPGLKVVLKDGTGSVIRQFTGEEFVRLRDATLKGSPFPGKILDRKL